MSNMRELVATAMGWLIRTETPDCTSDQREAFQRWLDEDVSHRVAVAVASKSRERIDRLSSLRPVDGRVDPDLLLSPEYMPRPMKRVRIVDGEKSPPRNRGPGRLRLFAFVAVGAASVCGFSVIGWYANRQLNWENYETHIGGKETSPLPDGTSVTLNTDSLLRVRMTSETREIKLIRGEAVIEATHNDGRPFRLLVGNTVLQTSGAEFDIRRRESGQIDVIVSNGNVSAETVETFLTFPVNAAQPTQSVIAAGYMASISPGDIQVSRLDADERARKTSWLDNVLDFRGETLAEEAEQFNRYNRRKIVIEDPRIAGRRFGGVFHDTDPESFVAALSHFIDIKATTVAGEDGPGSGTIRLSSAEARR
jgi:transmembrane sensor